MKDEVRDLQAEVQASNKSSEGILRHVQVCHFLLFPPFQYSLFINRNWFYLSSFFYLVKERKYLDTNVLKKKSGDHAVECLDFKVQDLRKKLNKLRYQARTKQQRIESLMKEYEKVVMINAEIEKAEEILEDSAEGQRLRYALYIKFCHRLLTTSWVDTIQINAAYIWIFVYFLKIFGEWNTQNKP